MNPYCESWSDGGNCFSQDKFRGCKCVSARGGGGVGKKKGERIEGEEDPLMNCRTKEIAATVGLLQVREGEVVQMLYHEMHLIENVHGL